jgi:16S rRNA (uracil1498-N3)-methyltransferase
MTDRYFVESPIQADRATLVGPEAHHLLHVMRAKPGAEVVLFDGSGAEFDAVVQRTTRAEVELTVRSRREVDRESPRALTLAVALPKGDRQKWLIEKAVELGVRRLVPLQTARGVAQPVAQALERLRRTVIEASKQCGRNRLMEIAAPQSLPELIAATADVACRLLAHPCGASDGRAAATRDWGLGIRDWRFGVGDRSSEVGVAIVLPPPADDEGRQYNCRPNFGATASCVAAVGPEGGFAHEEVALALAAGWQTLDLGPRILRVETAALAIAAMLVEGNGLLGAATL